MNDPRVSYERQPARPKPKAPKWYFIITFAIAFALAFYFSWKLVFENRPVAPKQTTAAPQP